MYIVQDKPMYIVHCTVLKAVQNTKLQQILHLIDQKQHNKICQSVNNTASHTGQGTAQCSGVYTHYGNDPPPGLISPHDRVPHYIHTN